MPRRPGLFSTWTQWPKCPTTHRVDAESPPPCHEPKAISSNADPAAGEERYLTFSLGGESDGLPVLNVREIIRLCPITPVPRMPPHVRGVINFRGTVIAVLTGPYRCLRYQKR